MAAQGLPYGPKARQLMLHICTMAVRQNPHQIEIVDNMSAFIRELGFPVTGGARGTTASRYYSITSSACASTRGGIVTPSTLAVLRLITISNFVGCWTGRSPGFSPLKILSTYPAERR